ncbi:hypothetical protein CPB86DRAFT_757643 [Serendipita vermifera]|nr:hypothetical protein CPB86DRAFT_757643 [Serendipita vermifera]
MLRKTAPSNLARTAPSLPTPIREDYRAVQKFKHVAASLPFKIESEEEMQSRLDLILARLVQAVESQDYEYGLLQWDSILASWLELKYPLPRPKRIALIKLFYQICVVPGMPTDTVSACMDTLAMLTRSKKKISIDDLRLPWKPVYDILSRDLFLKRRQFEYNQTTYNMAYVAENVRKFFPPVCIDEMLQEFVPHIIGSNLDQILANQYYLVTFLPLSHPQYYLSMMFRLWEAVNSYAYDERMLHFLSRLAEMHVDPSISNPKRVDEIPADWDDSPPVKWPRHDSSEDWKGLYKDVGMFSDDEWNFIMCKCLISMEIPLADAGSLTTGPSVDGQAGFEIGRLPRCPWRIASLARIIVYSMTPDSAPAPVSGTSTPFSAPIGTPLAGTSPSKVADYFSVALGPKGRVKDKRYLGGSKALDSFSKLIISCESFFHPTNGGKWTNDLTALIKYVVFEFNKRWQEELKPECKVPKSRRLTSAMRRELVRCLRTVCLLSIFSSDTTTTSNVQSAFKSMISMEPDLILPSILERAVPALETLTETQRTLAIIKGLGAVSMCMTSRSLYYPGAKHIAPILELLIPGVDLNDPTKTVCTSSLVKDIAQFIKFGDLTEFTNSQPNGFISPAFLSTPGTPGTPRRTSGTSTPTMKIILPTINIAHGFTGDETPNDSEPRLPDSEEDALVKESTASFSNFVTSWFRRVITLMENLPEEGQPGTRAGGEDEVAVIDNVGSTCVLICQHLSEPLFDLVLNILYDYATSHVRPNALRAIHQLVECLAIADPQKTLERFVPHCIQHIRTEIEHGASSLRTTSSSDALPSDATLHWNLAILRGAMVKDGRRILPYKDELKDLLRLLLDKTYSKRGYQWASRLLYSILLACTNTYPLDDRFVNADEWHSPGFLHSHYKRWGKMYSIGEVGIQWHVPNKEEIAFAIELMDDIVALAMERIEKLLEDNVTRDAVWRNDFCRNFAFLQEAFSSIGALAKAEVTQEETDAYYAATDLPKSIPEMIAKWGSIETGYPLRDEKEPRYTKIMQHRRRFADILLRSSRTLRHQGEENTVDAIQAVVTSFQIYLTENGVVNADNWSYLRSRFNEEKNVARLYAGQREWPRALWVLKARFYRATRMRSNSLERIRTDIENSMIDELIEWSMCLYATVRSPAQNILSKISETYDGVRRRVMPKIYESLVQGTDDDRMKGALYLLNYPSFGKYAATEPEQLPLFVKHLFGCQHNEKPSIQNVASSIAENALSNFVEQSQSVYNLDCEPLHHAAQELFKILPEGLQDREVIRRNADICKARLEVTRNYLEETEKALLAIGTSDKTHWRYSIVALRMLRALVRREIPNSSSQMQYFLSKTTDNHPSIRYYSQRAVMKMLRYIKVRSHSKEPQDLILQSNNNSLRRSVPVQQPSHNTTREYLQAFAKPIDWNLAQEKPILQDKAKTGWLAWSSRVDFLLAPSEKETWEEDSRSALETLRNLVLTSAYWEKLRVHYAEENQSSAINWDNVSFVKSIFQMIGDEPWDSLRPTVTKLLEDIEQNKQRAAAEFLAGLLGGSKNWPITSQVKIWNWIEPQLPKILGQNVKSDTLNIWTSFLEYLLGNRDPRRSQPIVDYIINESRLMEYNQELSFEAVRICCFTQAMAESLGWRFQPWIEPILERHWQELASDHDEVRAYIADALELFDKIMWQPKPTVPTTEAFVRECHTLYESQDIMSIREGSQLSRFKKLLPELERWRTERLPGARAIHSQYDRAASTILKWLFLGLHDIQAVSSYAYVIPFIPELLRMSELNDNHELAQRAGFLLTRTCGVIPPKELITPFLNTIFQVIEETPSWRIRLKALPLLQVFYFRQMQLLSDVRVVQILEVVCKCLDDENISVRETAATTLSGILRCSPRQSVITLKDRFQRLARKTKIPPRDDPNYQASIRTLHSAILGIGALLDAYPYSCPSWVPGLITDVLSKHTHSPLPISTTVRKTAMNFKRTHQDTWAEDQKKFDEDGLSALSLLLTGSSYYA